MTGRILNREFIFRYGINLSIFLGAALITVTLFGLLSLLQGGGIYTSQVKEQKVYTFLKEKPTTPPPELEELPPMEEPLPKSTIKESTSAGSEKKIPKIHPLVTQIEFNSKLSSGLDIGPIFPKAIKVPPLKNRYAIWEVDQAPKATLQVPPDYPYHARRQGIEGVVSIRFLVTKEGEVDNLKVIDSEPEGVFEETTIRTVPRWIFSPGLKQGEAVDTWVEMDIEFDLDSSNKS